MTVEEFERSLSAAAPPAMDANLTALWWAGKDEWDRAHDIVQVRSDRDASWVHAYLHRVEGDLANAGYWYRRAARPTAEGDLRTEWRSMVSALLTEMP